MNRLCSLAVVATAVSALRVDARACEPVGTFPHTVDMSMQAADQTPPTLPAIPAPIVHYADDTSDGVGCGGAKCGDVTYVGIPAVATDDMTDRYRIGYRLSLESGTVPANFALPTTAIDPTGDAVRIFFNSDIDSFDFTLQVVAIDLAGNESAPQSVRVVQMNHACAIAGAPAAPSRCGSVVLATALVLAARRRCRRCARRPGR
jgi:hypothetical protein